MREKRSARGGFFIYIDIYIYIPLSTHIHIYIDVYIKVKIKQSRNRPGVAQRVPGGLGSQVFKTLGT
jgi:hypothetical protein